MAKLKEYQSEEIAIPAAAFKKYFNNFNREKRLLLLALIASIVLIVAAITTLVALPILMPAAFGIAATGGWIVFEIFLAESTLLALLLPFVAYDALYTKQISAQNKAANYKLSKKITDDLESTVFRNKKSLPKSLDKKIDQKLEMENNIIGTVQALIKDLESDQKNLETQETVLNQDVQNNLNNDKKLKILSTKMTSLRVKKTTCEKHLADAKTSLEHLNSKHALTIEQKQMTTNQKIATKNLSIILNKNKALLVTIVKDETTLTKLKQTKANYPLLEESFQSQIKSLENKTNQAREQLRKDLTLYNDHVRATIKVLKDTSLSNPEKNAIIEPVLKEMKSDLFSILNPVLTTDFDKLSLEDKDYALSLISLCFEHMPKETTEHYSRLLENNLSHQKTIDMINQIIENDASLTKKGKESLNFTLANHFLRRLLNDHKQENGEKACLYALKLDSNESNNADFKEEVIRAAFFFEHEIPNDFPSEPIQEILANSHDTPNAYQAIKTLIENNPSYKHSPSAVLLKESIPLVPSQLQEAPAAQKPPPKIK